MRCRGVTRFAKTPGCALSGFVLVKKVPGTLHFLAKSPGHSFDHETINMTHTVNYMYFGNKPSPRRRKVGWCPVSSLATALINSEYSGAGCADILSACANLMAYQASRLQSGIDCWLKWPVHCSSSCDRTICSRKRLV